MKRVLFVLFFAASLIINAQVQSRFINVTGTAEIIAQADCIVFNAQIRTVNESMEQAKKINDRNLDELLTTIKSNGVNSDDIEIAPVSLGKNYEYGTSGRKERGYFANVNLTFKLKDFSKYLKLTEKIAKNPSAALNSSFELSKEKLQILNKEARLKALAAAKEKAEYMAAALKTKLGSVSEIEEVDGESPTFRGMGALANISAKMDTDMLNEPVAGNITIKKTVRVKFDILIIL